MDQMLSKYLFVTFPNDKQAYEGVRALRDLDGEGVITLYGYAVVQRGADGAAVVKDSQGEGPVGTAAGTLAGALFGIVAGPGGVALGAAIGSAVGAVRDLFALGMSSEFIDDVAKVLAPDATALVAEISEDWLTPLDSRMAALGGNVLREWRNDYVDDEMEKRINRARAEFTARRAEMAAAAADKKETLKKEVAKAEQNLRSALDKVETRLHHFNEETRAKVHALQEQAKKVGAEKKQRIEERIAAVKADQARRKGKLEEARKLALEALKP